VFRNQLWCVHRGADSRDLMWTVLNPFGWTWSDSQAFGAHQADTGAALAVFQGRLWCVHRGGNDENLWWTVFDGQQWGPDQKFPAHLSSANPGLLAYQAPTSDTQQLLCVHRGHD
jgi:hypothetical protein